jgi:hypothetical protein
MANIWIESLDRKAICMRGWSENTSIDPSDTTENMAKFLSCLETALDPAQAGHDDTTLTLAPGDTSATGENGITLNIAVQLTGFDALRWPVHLKKQLPSAVATNLVLPLIQAHFNTTREVQSLTRTVADKDSVISKLSDKLEAMGTGLEHVFTALSGRKKVTRAAADDRVKGLAPFNERRWKTDIDSDDAGPSSVTDLIQHVFGGTGLESRSTIQVDKSPELDEWWHDFLPSSQGRQRKQHDASSSQRPAATPPPPSKSFNEDDDFQVQSTPPRLRSTKKSAATSNVPPNDGDSTEGEEESMIPDSNPPSVLSDRRRRPETTKPKISRLGAIGGNTKPAPPRSPSPPAQGKTAKTPGDDEETASEASDDDATASAPASSPAPSPPKPTIKKAGLGRIGAGAVQAHPDPKEKTPEVTRPPKTREMAPKKLGTIGGKSSKPVKQEDEEVTRGRPAHRGMSSPTQEQPRETSEERADRKREELKRELEKKSAAGPARKKRRF